MLSVTAAIRTPLGRAAGLLLLISCVVSCGAASRLGTLPSSSPPVALDDGWEVGPLTMEQLDPARLLSLEQSIVAGDFEPPDALLIARGGRLVYEQYWNGFDRARLHDLRSATKSVTALLTGIAIDEGRLPGADAAVAGFFPEYQALTGRDARLGRITLAHLLTMSSGLECNDWNPDSAGKEEKMYKSADWLKFVLGLPVAGEPGSVTTYCTGGVNLLGGAIARATATSIPSFAERALFSPLRIASADVKWAAAPAGETDTGGHLQLRPRDLLKLGQLVLDGGRWQGRQVVSANWLSAATTRRVHLGDSDYGYLWWRNTFHVNGRPFDFSFARGNGGQYLFVFPEQKLTALFMASRYDSPIGDQALELCARFILTALPAP
ncbi:MAG TPA: serine hydrolase [Pseudomonadota bacterium]|nr:serine hydrolase [Pseudomonadota bacterium]